MSVAVKVSARAEAQLDRAVLWYLEHAPEQIERLLAYFDEALKLIADYPQIGTRRGELRFVATQVFPYHLWYVVETRKAIVVAVTHVRQDVDPSTLYR